MSEAKWVLQDINCTQSPTKKEKERILMVEKKGIRLEDEHSFFIFTMSLLSASVGALLNWRNGLNNANNA